MFKFEETLKKVLSSIEEGTVHYNFIIDVGALEVCIVSKDSTSIYAYPTIGGERVLIIGDYKERLPITTRKILKKMMEIIDRDFHVKKRKVYNDERELIEECYFSIERK